ncbi:hypothetical protein OG585_39955 [Streptomyces sp. NBC_01340]|uniref:hypothetical protein n=1 Tax=unclassified Streptomyces TaxID=2593676 RepID=UPI00225B83BC|nr:MULTISPECIES: hypothetical protein [unclassified Streptomyces]MCX4458942.1 hypothetical protein [Streptomyces sp. NBC_01719]MCX4498299.1 hypothetical protein [Streptomyces sp. NBC_01728]WSI44467.1 hypothetical protein OG585_39955 [Streptomyces sp. NBC_01340]
MAAATDVLIPVLEDVREAHAAVVARFRADAASTPPGADRHRVERRAAEVQGHLARIEDRVRAIRPSRGPLAATAQLLRFVALGAVRATTLPLEATVSAVTEIVRSQQPGDQHTLLKHAEDEYAAAARAVATCQAGENIAEQLNDRESADLLHMLRRQDEQLLESIEENVTQRAGAVAAATNGHRPPQAEAIRAADGGSLLDTVMGTMRVAVARVGAVLQKSIRLVTDTAEGVLRERPYTHRAAEEAHGALTREQDLPIPGFGGLGVPEIQQHLCDLSQMQLTVVEGYERAHARRSAVLNAITQLREAEPLAGYDTMSPEEIKAQLPEVCDDAARQVLEYERRHRRREMVIDAAEVALHVPPEATHRTEGDVRDTATREGSAHP